MMPHDQLRVSDDERRAVDDLLQRAAGDGLITLAEYDERSTAAWAARTRGELSVLTEDLPLASPLGRAATQPVPGRQRAIAIFGEERIDSPAAGGATTHAVAVCGHSVLDFRYAALEPVTRVTATALLGQVEILVPRGTRIVANGTGIMGTREVKTVTPAPDAPVVMVRATTVMGSVEVKDGSKKLDRLQDALSERLAERRRRLVPGGLRAHAQGIRDEMFARRAEGGWRPPRISRRAGIAAAAAGVVLMGGIAVAGADHVGLFSDRTIVAGGEEHEHDSSTVFGSTTIEVPAGSCVEITGIGIGGDIRDPQHRLCSGTNGSPVTVRVNRVFSDVTLTSRA